MRHRSGHEEQQPGDDTVSHHADDGGIDADRCHGGDAQHYKTHVADGRKRDEPLHVCLRQAGQRGVDDADDGQDADHRSPVLGLLGQDRDGDPDERIRTKLQHDGRQQHRTDGGRRGVGVGKPGVQWEHRHLDGEAEEERGKHPHGQPAAEHAFRAVGGELEHVEGAAALEVQHQETKKHECRAEQREEEELDRRVEPHLSGDVEHRERDLVAVAPDADHEVHREQHDFEEDEEQNQVEGHERPGHTRGQDQNEDQERLRIVRLRPMLPAVDDGKQAHERRQDDKRQADAVNADVEIGVDGGDPVDVGTKLDPGLPEVEGERQDHR